MTHVIVYKDGAPSEIVTNAGPLQYEGGGTILKVHGTKGGITKTFRIPMIRIASVQ